MMNAKPHLLIVEDNPDHQELFFDALQEGYRITFSRTPEECLSRLRDIAIDLILLDYYLQNEYAGLSLLQKITSLYPGLPVIFVTAHGDEEIAASAIKTGATNYFRKTPDYDYLTAITDNIREILTDKSTAAPPRLSGFLTEHRKEFIERWKQKMIEFKMKLGLSISTAVSDDVYGRLFESVAEDLADETGERTLSVYKSMIWSSSRQSNTLLLVELLNTACREAMRDLARKYHPLSPGARRGLLEKMAGLIDRNDLKLSKEYEYVVGESTDNLLRMERISTKLLLMRTLQHEIRQPLTYIFNAVELLLGETPSGQANQTLRAILEQAVKIEHLLGELEKDSETPLKDYSDKLPMFDLSAEGDG